MTEITSRETAAAPFAAMKSAATESSNRLLGSNATTGTGTEATAVMPPAAVNFAATESFSQVLEKSVTMEIM
jgi:hypothetical protein